MPPNLRSDVLLDASSVEMATDAALESLKNTDPGEHPIRVALLGCGMMGQEHISYIQGYPNLSISFLCDPHEPSLKKSMNVLQEFQKDGTPLELPELLQSEDELLERANDIDLLVIASPNHLHTDTIIRWGSRDISILCEKPVAVSLEQHSRLSAAMKSTDFCARVWVAMEYRYIPAIAKLLDLIPTIGDIKMITIRENRYPFLHKIGEWNRDRNCTGDTMVEKCCHFFDLFRLISGQEVNLPEVKTMLQRGINYQDEESQHEIPIIDSAFVIFPFLKSETVASGSNAMGCLELCMFAEGSRHQEEIIVTGTTGRVEAYLPENKVFAYNRPGTKEWNDRTEPPPNSSIQETVYDCSDVRKVHGIETEIPTHGGYHYSSTAIEWHKLIGALSTHNETGKWEPEVKLADGLDAVRIGLQATQSI
mmetsp:Transcript_2831/g.5712  ORF Transcript_2831/g.5712 Transcript_2831/m.5712 type:complete len:422 (-) Transcript_2831:91-1356(-)|eukprot:CAMPEP_0172458718 /NCGR_PEP_ID=MMETSP1065-20121228/28923_1 /TAXON_ID=265537 /ORGANISM="Amphiprora paludosa, Strain CCMP125" /LENGTH=421 /DNA_ID=CAMNT_0013213111 /DNA_START=87 /DNA_END=1352 /DNA_ORIENTATION=-